MRGLREASRVTSTICWSCEAQLAARAASTPRGRLSWTPGRTLQLHRAGQQTRWQSTQSKAPRKGKSLIRGSIVVALLAGAALYFSSSGSSKTTLNDITFAPYTITTREAISPTSFVLTISPHHPESSLPYLNPDSSSWRHPLWSVEFKQPEVQIARHYTPLPPREGDDPRDGTLRFYVRAIGDGEMSNYLGRLRQGQDVFLRGPHRGFDVLARLGQRKQLVVLAGGTGVVPGMQAAEAVLAAREDTAVRLLWAVRKREELQNAPPPPRASWWVGPEPTEVQSTLTAPSSVGHQLEQMKEKYGDRLKVHVAVDEEGSAFSQKFLADTSKNTKTGDSPANMEEKCTLHSQIHHQRMSEFEVQTPECSCGGIGKNLLLVSGPDGFIGHYTGPKVWLGGSHTQGRVGGIAGQVQAQDARFKSEWLVLKL